MLMGPRSLTYPTSVLYSLSTSLPSSPLSFRLFLLLSNLTAYASSSLSLGVRRSIPSVFCLDPCSPLLCPPMSPSLLFYRLQFYPYINLIIREYSHPFRRPLTPFRLHSPNGLCSSRAGLPWLPSGFPVREPINSVETRRPRAHGAAPRLRGAMPSRPSTLPNRTSAPTARFFSTRSL